MGSGEALAHTSSTPLSLQACCISFLCLISLWGSVASLTSSPKALQKQMWGLGLQLPESWAMLSCTKAVWRPWCCSMQWVQNGREVLVLSTSPLLFYWVAQACWQLQFRKLMVALCILCLPVGLTKLETHSLHSPWHSLFWVTKCLYYQGNHASTSSPPPLALFFSCYSLESIEKKFLRSESLAAAGW